MSINSNPSAPDFLPGYEYRPGEFPRIEGYNARGLILGKGTPGLEVLVYTGTRRPSKDGLHKAWKERLSGRGIPLIIVAIYDHHCSICGHSERSRGQIPVHPDLPIEHAERLCATALELPDHHTVDRFLRDHLPESQSPIFGIRNQGLLATYVLQRGEDEIGTDAWRKAAQKSIRLRTLKDKELLSGLGYAIEPLTGPASILTAKGSHLALAVFLDQNEIAELPSRRFGNQTPVSYALQMAQSHNLNWVIVSRGSEIRLYPTRTDVGVGRRGLTDTYLSLDLQLLPEKRLPFAWLILSEEGLRDDGFFKDLRERSERYAKDIGERLRDRIYTSVIPQLAMAIVKARKLKKPSSKDLDLNYQMAMLVLFRLLFVAYAEDHDLLPYRTNELYRSRSLTRLAHELKRIIDENRGFDPGSSLWDEVIRLWKAVRDGQSEWDIPPYDGGMFEDGKDHPAGAELAKINLSNREFGLILSFLLLDENTPEGLGPVDFRSLGVREFGTIYEGLLENELSVAEFNLTTDKKGHYKPTDNKKKVVVSEGEIYLHNKSGARKASGSYYTKSFAVDHLLDHSLEPALDEHLEKVAKAAKSDAERASRMLFEFYVADIAMGSGHFLISAIDRIEKRFLSFLGDNPLKGVDAELEKLRMVAREKLGEAVDERRLEKNQLLRRLIARRCIYGVDLNPLAVELARLSVWIHTFVPGLPLSFLDHNLVCGNSLVGIGTFEEALEELTSKGHTFDLFEDPAKKWLGAAQKEIQALREISDADIGEIDKAKEAHEGIRKKLSELSAFFDILSAARLDKEIVKKMGSGAAGFLTNLTELENLFGKALHKKARKATSAIPPFHFPVAFPEVFLREQPGFDVIIGNPPWEKSQVEEHEFWARQFPGFRGMRQTDREVLIKAYEKERADLGIQFKREKAQAEELRQVLMTGPYPGMGSGHPDLYKAFCWKFWHLASKSGGRLGVVLPRSAWFAKGSELFRKEVFTNGRVDNITYLLNSGGWVFDDAEHRYTIALTSLEKSTTDAMKQEVSLRGPYRGRPLFDEGMSKPPVSFKVSDVLAWTDTASLPLLPSEESAEVFLQMRKAPRLDCDIGGWRCRPVQGDLNATTGKPLMKFTDSQPKSYWPVYKGESFDLWNPDTGSYYAYAQPKSVTKHLQEKRERGHKNARSVFSECSESWVSDSRTLPCLHSRIAFRDVTNRTNQRTTIVSLVPPEIVIVHTAPTFIFPVGDAKDVAYLLGILSSIPLDWYARCIVETHLTFDILMPFPVPRPEKSDKFRLKAISISGRLACLDKRFAEFAKEVGVKYGPLPEDEKNDMIYELDAVVAHLYGLKEKQLIHIFETFHVGWDYEERLRVTLKHFKAWKKKVK